MPFGQSGWHDLHWGCPFAMYFYRDSPIIQQLSSSYRIARQHIDGHTFCKHVTLLPNAVHGVRVAQCQRALDETSTRTGNKQASPCILDATLPFREPILISGLCQHAGQPCRKGGRYWSDWGVQYLLRLLRLCRGGLCLWRRCGAIALLLLPELVAAHDVHAQAH